MAIPDPLITEAIQQSSYYPKYQKMVAENTKKTPQGSASMQPATKRATPKKPTTTTPVKQSKPAPLPTTNLPSNRILREGHDSDLELAKKLSLETHQEKGKGEGDDADLELAIKLSLDPALLPQSQAPVGGVTIRDPVSETTPKLHEVVGKGKAVVTEEQVAHSLIDLSKKKRTTDQFILARRDQTPPDSTTGPSSQHDDDSSEKVIHESSSTSDSERTESDTEAAAPKGDSKLQMKLTVYNVEVKNMNKSDVVWLQARTKFLRLLLIIRNKLDDVSSRSTDKLILKYLTKSALLQSLEYRRRSCRQGLRTTEKHDIDDDEDDEASAWSTRVDQQRGKKKLCKADLEGPAFNLVKAFHKNSVFLQYQMDECHKLLTNKVDLSNLEGDKEQKLLIHTVMLLVTYDFGLEDSFLRCGLRSDANCDMSAVMASLTDERMMLTSVSEWDVKEAWNCWSKWFKDFHLYEYNKGMETRKWSEDDKRRSKDFITAIEKRLQIRRIYRSLERFVGGRDIFKDGDGDGYFLASEMLSYIPNAKEQTLHLRGRGIDRSIGKRLGEYCKHADNLSSRSTILPALFILLSNRMGLVVIVGLGCSAENCCSIGANSTAVVHTGESY
ncbi:hypothetical protein Tco_1408152 [Tanacetum coccineum]